MNHCTVPARSDRTVLVWTNRQREIRDYSHPDAGAVTYPREGPRRALSELFLYTVSDPDTMIGPRRRRLDLTASIALPA